MEAGISQGVNRPVDVSADMVVNRVSFHLPRLPGSLNVLYEFNHINSGLPVKRLKAEWALWISQMMPYIPCFKIQSNSVLRVDRVYHLPWFYKNGKWRKVDVINLDALLFNLVSRRVGIDDMYVKCGMLGSRDSDKNKVEVTIIEVTEAEWRMW